jgi:Arc/MetJ family transcription regulator
VYADVYNRSVGRAVKGIFMRTNIVIDESLMQKAMEMSGIKSKKDVVNAAIAEFVERRTRRDLSELRGKIKFADGYDYKALRKERSV